MVTRAAQLDNPNAELRSYIMQKFITVLILATTLSGLSDSVTAWEAEIERDIWGVPHIKGVEDADAAYGLGYAMAEDT